ncbi:hypothetical protein [Flavobacterium sp. A45]|uniref:hypothetical protein n=1 Tax=Flavobacterium sp. A45 TaxID=1945862 RepID=UPI000985C265|nr:hypothetical protein [Flavobacterium sp. A45]OOG75460.1 hypothetical protein B0E44_04665 [Flavobacterium sp. A45]
MKNLKNYFILALIAFTLSAVFIACSSENEQLQEPKSSSKVNSTKKLAQTKNIAQTICDITGTTVVSVGNAVVTAGSSATYSYTNNTGTATNIVWTISPNPAGSATITANGSTVTVTYLANFISGTLSAAGSGGTAQTCNTILNIATPSGGSSGDCACPNPVIRCTLAVSGGHPYWRFELDNLQSGDTFVWSHNHAPIFGSLTNNSYVIANPEGPLNSGFTLYCEVTRRCTNGTIKKRKAFYTNYYGGTTTSGTQGFINLGGSCDLLD